MEGNQDGRVSLRCIVKFGGAAITRKDEIETINEEALRLTSSQLREAMMSTTCSSAQLPGMDWSKQPGCSDDVMENASKFQGEAPLQWSKFLVVHGAGSFGHFQASKSGVNKGGLHQPLVKAGLVATRISVTSLNLEIVRALAREGIPSLGMSPFACGWSTCGRNVVSGDTSHVAKAVNSGFVPVLHGDAVFDDYLGCTILSGDLIILHIAKQLQPDYVVFLTDVPGVYDRPPSDPNAILLTEIVVDEDGSWSVIEPPMGQKVKFSVASHDTTGGMMAKIDAAVMIAKLGIDVFIVKAGTEHALSALQGEIKGAMSTRWIGTAIRPSQPR